MNNFEMLALGLFAVVAVSGVVICWRLISAVTELSTASSRESARERLDGHRLTTQLVAKMVATKEQQERIEDLHAQETFRKWKLAEQTEQIGAAAKHGVAQSVAEPARAEEQGVGPGVAEPYQ